MFGAIAGDIIGSPYEGRPIKTTAFPLFIKSSCYTDDTVLTVAVADAIMNKRPFAEKLRQYYNSYPRAGYGGSFIAWAGARAAGPYGSYGNGSAMRASPVGWAYNTLKEVHQKAKESAGCTHNHPEGIKGAQAAASAVFLARAGNSKAAIKTYIQNTFGYDLNRTIDEIRPGYKFDVSCQGTVPEAIIAFMESTNYEDAVRKAVSLGGDSDTLACITGGIAEAYYGGVPKHIKSKASKLLDKPLLDVANKFERRFMRQ